MELLRILQQIRTPFLDDFFLAITTFGEKTAFMLIGFLILWCIEKKRGYYVIFVGLWGLLINQFLKITFRVPRPWVQDSELVAVESAKEGATGYSFPSGHTQISVGLYGSVAKVFKNKIVRILSIMLCILVPISRLYLGVHTPLDVGVSVLAALVLIYVFYPLFYSAFDDEKSMRMIFFMTMLLSFLYIIYVDFFSFSRVIDIAGYVDASQNARQIFGLIAGAWIGYEIDIKYINFKTDGVWWVQVLKLILGAILVIGIQNGLKNPIDALLGDKILGETLRCFLVALFSFGIWPFTFKYFALLSREKETK